MKIDRIMDIKYRYSLTMIFIWALFLMGCSENNDKPEGGYDNRILSFTLTNDGQEYVGSITATDEVVVRIPYETDLSTAKVDYRISELASILPKPQSITNWNEDHAFNVISHSGEKRTYVVRIVEMTEVSEKDVFLTTDDDVKAFIKRGVEKVEGSLIIGKPSGLDSISNIDALTLLKEVGYKLIVNPTYKGKDLSGLRNLERIGSMEIREVKHLEKVKLPMLEYIRKDLIIKGEKLNELTMPHLKEVGGDVTIEFPKLTRIEWQELKSVGSLSVKCALLNTFKSPKLQVVERGVKFTEIENLSIFNMKGLKSVGGDFLLQKPTSLGMIMLPELSIASGKIEVVNSGARDIHFPKLEKAGSFLIVNNQGLKEVSAPMLNEVEKDFSIKGAGVQKLDHFKIAKVGGKLILHDLSMLQTVGELFNNLKEIDEIDLANTLLDGTIDLSKLAMKKVQIASCSNVAEIILPSTLEEFSFSGTLSYKHPMLTKISGLKEVSKFAILDYAVADKSNLSIPDLVTVSEELRIRVANFESLTFEELQKVERLDLNMATAWYSKDMPMEVEPLQVLSAPKLLEIERMICNEPWLHTLDFPELTTMGSLNISCYYPFQKNDKMTNLNKMPKLNSLSSVSFQNLVVFKDYSFLKTVVENGTLTRFTANNCLYSPSFDDLKAGKFVKP